MLLRDTAAPPRSPLPSSASKPSYRAVAPAPLRVAVIGNHPPRSCGIATFTRDTVVALQAAGAVVDLTVMDDRGATYPYPATVSRSVDQGSREAHRAAGRRIAAWNPDAVLVQHEFGIFGGPSGLWLLDMMNGIDAEFTVTLHTVLERFTPDQRTVLDGMVALGARFVVMARLGVERLAAQGVPRGRIHVVPHGAPDRPFADPAETRRRIGWPNRPTVLTFGLLSPGKGIEHVIEALPNVLKTAPNTRYVLLGATHPHLVATEGERYRDGLRERAKRLGVAHALHMEPRFVDDAALLDALDAADVYVLPYGNMEQITSGTLAFAFARGKPIVSTPFAHAREILEPDQLVPFGDAAALAERIAAYLADDAARSALARRTYERARATVWPVVGRRLLSILGDTAPVETAPSETARAG